MSGTEDLELDDEQFAAATADLTEGIGELEVPAPAPGGCPDLCGEAEAVE